MRADRAGRGLRRYVRYRQGQIVSWTYNGCRVVEAGPRLQFWRAAIDNDMYLVPDYKQKTFLHLMHEVVEEVAYEMCGEECVHVRVHTMNAPTNASWHYRSVYEYRIYGNGDVLFEVRAFPAAISTMRRRCCPASA